MECENTCCCKHPVVKSNCKNVANIITTKSHVVTQNSQLPLDKNLVLYGPKIVHEKDSSTVTLKGAGCYLVLVTTNVAPATGNTVSVAISNNGTVIPSTVITQNAQPNSNGAGVSTQTIVCLDECETNAISIVNAGTVSETFTNSNLIVLKIC